MFEIGSSLRQARQHRGLELADVERETHIRVKYLGALEDERFDVLPGHAYVRGFLRTYAEFLGLDGNLYVEELNQRFAPPANDPPATQHAPIHRRELRFVRPAAGTLLALAAATVVVWQLGSSSPQGQPAPAEQAVTPTAKTTAVPKLSRSSVSTPAAAPAGPALLVVRATRGDCWVAVRVGSATGRVIYEHTLAQRGTLRFGLQKPLWVRLGAPWNADVTLRGTRLAAFPGGRPVTLQAS
jgi:cytoskeletal protein RodZ